MRLSCGRFVLELTTPVVMGVVNVTPDSFSDGGRFADAAAAVEHALAMVEAGAAIIDVGGESTRPGAGAVPAAEEIRRVVPVLESLCAVLPVPVSVDTRKPEVMRAAIASGASMINDVGALRAEGALEAVAASDVALCLMHMQGEPGTMQRDPSYTDVVAEVRAFLAARVAACEAAGVDRSRLVIDPGFGFGKTAAHNLSLLARLGEFAALDLPLLVGLSRKSLVGALTGRATDERLAGSLVLAAFAVERGAAIVRAHDVAATVDAIKVACALATAEHRAA